jgi:hypothetical protein
MLMSYYLDYYTSQYTEGNFSFVYNFKLERELKLIEEGLQLLGAEKHLELFQQQCKSQIDELVKRDKFFKSNWKGKPIRDLMNSDTFE